MATVAELAAIRSHVGTQVPPSDTHLAVLLARLGTVEAVALDVVRSRLADLRARPAKFTAQGDYSEDWTGNLTSLADQETVLAAAVAAGTTAGGGVVTVGRLVRHRARR